MLSHRTSSYLSVEKVVQFQKLCNKYGIDLGLSGRIYFSEGDDSGVWCFDIKDKSEKELEEIILKYLLEEKF